MKFSSKISVLLFSAVSFATTLMYAQQPTDCVNAITVCGDSEINLDVNGIGSQELFGLNNCSSQENNSLWLKVTLITDGTLGFILTPDSSDISEDYDFFVFGPNRDCSNLGQAIRCSTTNPQAAGQTNNLTGMNGSQTDTSEGPGPDGNSFVRWLDVSAGETYYIVIDRPIGNSPFNLEWIGTAEFASPPVNESGSVTALNIENCDTVSPFDDNSTSFDLSVNTTLIIGSQSNVSVSYFESESDANINNNEILGVYNNISNPQEVYAKLTDNITGCFEIIPFELTVSSGPDYTEPSDYQLCDNNEDGNATNGQVTFDLSIRSEEILTGQDASDLNISYHLSENDANAGINELPINFYNTDANQQTIFVRIENISNPDCFSIDSFELIVSPLPILFNAEQIQCSDGQTALFNLTHSNAELTNNEANRSTIFFLNFNDAIIGNNPISNITSFSNTSNPQIIFVQVKDNETDCFSISELTLRISNTNVSNAQLIACDDDSVEDGFYEFNLIEVEDIILSGVPDTASITYYENFEDAQLETNPISVNYTNTVAYNQILFARVENDDNCFGIAEIQLVVNNLPEIETEALYYYCLNSFPETITIDANISDVTNFEFLWSTGDQTEAIQINEPGNYAVQVQDVLTGCINTRTVIVEASNVATIDSIEVEDASENNIVVINVSGEGIYEYALFNEFGSYTPFQSSNVFSNVLGGIYTAQVRDIKNGCGITVADIFVIGFPKFFTPNGDGQNDTWNIKGLTSLHQANSKIVIFDRYGKLIKELSPLGDGWDGTFNGEILPISDYWFEITLQDGRSFKDHFTLKR